MRLAPGTYKVTATDKDGKPTHNEWTGKFDGNDYPVTGDPNTDTRSLKRIDAHTLGLTGKKAGKVLSPLGELSCRLMAKPALSVPAELIRWA